MIARATVYLDGSRTQAVGADDPKGRFLLVKQGAEISQREAEKYPGAVELIGGTKANPAAGPEARETQLETRDPVTSRRK